MSKKRPRHLQAGEFSEEEKYKRNRIINSHWKETIATRWLRWRWGISDMWGRKSNGCLWTIIRNYVLAPLLLLVIISLLHMCLG